MSGHSKWSKIKRKKGALDAKRSKMFSSVVKEITIAVKEGGSADPESNSRLRLAINNAKGVNMPKENIDRAISKADKEGANLEEVIYEGYAPNGIALVIECLTDNTNRSVSFVRSVFNKYNSNLGKTGSLSFLFESKGVFTIPLSDKINMDDFELEIIDAGAQDFEVDDSVITITTAKEDFGNMQKKLDSMGIQIQHASLQRIPNETKIIEADAALRVLKMIDAFEEIEDVQNVFHNLELTDEIAAAMEE
ncbi:MAG: transcriptional regulator [Bacteroidetes bacterium GWC2_33_15]|nr:MAG: transcriptional regulator [Bacteroidetes bacterium GWA2_33_15]OFX51231.1 MAG: transcriptional regulator [Bacteroidetes bacterium GWC2_33_15]OFX66341.1 MAG: transcriptional regulator [Bacteroidetes bacterium GWB2_32_14]OFX70634.1 MAG: transcriptional regulator [Bacteroidetes bacterium GWD2_33_33]HAN18779.1 YebC/PmpR family DNA-binding transcriptional regulator [Bacteroidales bacterium]